MGDSTWEPTDCSARDITAQCKCCEVAVAVVRAARIKAGVEERKFDNATTSVMSSSTANDLGMNR